MRSLRATVVLQEEAKPRATSSVTAIPIRAEAAPRACSCAAPFFESIISTVTGDKACRRGDSHEYSVSADSVGEVPHQPAMYTRATLKKGVTSLAAMFDN